jgi:hypothetical protein
VRILLRIRILSHIEWQIRLRLSLVDPLQLPMALHQETHGLVSTGFQYSEDSFLSSSRAWVVGQNSFRHFHSISNRHLKPLI